MSVIGKKGAEYLFTKGSPEAVFTDAHGTTNSKASRSQFSTKFEMH